MELHTIGIDLGKTVFHLVGLDLRGEVVVRKKFSRTQLLRLTANVHVRLIGMEACGGSHFLGRALREQRHEVRLIPAQYGKPYVKTNKSDYIDAEAIAEAVARPTMRFVPIKTDDQLDMQSLHRVRERWVMRRTAVINQIRGLLLERGITLRKGRHHVDVALPLILEDADANLSGAVRLLLTQLKLDLDQLSVRIDEADAVIQKTAHEKRSLLAARGHPWHRTSHGHCTHRGDRQRRGLPQKGGSSQLGWGWFLVNTPPAVSRSCSVSANVGTLTCEDCSCKAHARSCNSARSSLPV
jgi:transposase